MFFAAAWESEYNITFAIYIKRTLLTARSWEDGERVCSPNREAAGETVHYSAACVWELPLHCLTSKKQGGTVSQIYAPLHGAGVTGGTSPLGTPELPGGAWLAP